MGVQWLPCGYAPDLHIVLRQCPRRSFEARASCHLNIVVVTSTQMRLPRSQMGT